MNEKKREKSHRDKKNPRSADKYRELRKETNAKRPKQYFVGESVETGGYWSREIV